MTPLPSKRGLWIVSAVVWLAAVGLGAGARAQSCLELSGAPFCGDQRAHTTVGSQVIFPHGPPGRRIGNYVVLQEDGKSRLAAGLPPKEGSAPPQGARPAGSVIGLDRGRDFGAFSFPSGAAGKLSGRP